MLSRPGFHGLSHTFDTVSNQQGIRPAEADKQKTTQKHTSADFVLPSKRRAASCAAATARRSTLLV
jgi:hypothetical protein